MASNTITALLAVSLIVGLIAASHGAPLDVSFSKEEDLETKAKRPFCNAFTGCGKKRASNENGNTLYSQSGDNSLVEDLNKFPRLMLAQAALWERLLAKYNRNRDNTNANY